MTSSSSFAFATCQVGAEGALKAEVQRVAPQLRPAFMRPGFVTFKSDVPLAVTFAPDLVFARAFAISLGKAADAAAVAALVPKEARRAHVWMRDMHAPDEPAAPDAQAPALALEKALAIPGGVAQDGEVVADVVGVDAGVWYVGAHVHDARRPGAGLRAYPGADPRFVVPAAAPSKAWAKIEQGMLLGGVDVRSARVIEIGASPGGVTHALLERGCEVVAIDPGELDPRVLESAKLTHIKAPVADVDPRTIEKPVDALVLDVNISPFAALRQIEPMVREHGDTLRTMFLTLKLGAWHMAARVPHLVAIVKKLHPRIATATAMQLPANKVEIFIVATLR